MAICPVRPVTGDPALRRPSPAVQGAPRSWFAFLPTAVAGLILNPELLEAGGKVGKLLLKAGQPASDVGRIAAPLRDRADRRQKWPPQRRKG